MDQLKKLKDEINLERKAISTTSLPMTIGELASLYKENELIINPVYQRFFRWNDEQKTRLIESVMLNIPMPSVFLQENKGSWEVIDGLQRLSTFFEFMGILKDAEGKVRSPLKLKKTKYLSHFENMEYGNGENSDEDLYFDQELRFSFRRYRIDITTINNENSHPDKKYEIFKRLNTGGSSLEPQEVRNAIMIQENKDIHDFISSLSKNIDFKEIFPVSGKQERESYRMEMLSRFLIADICDLSKSSESDLPGFLDEYMTAICDYHKNGYENEYVEKTPIDLDSIEDKFKRTCRLLNEVLGDSSFKKFNQTKKKFEGAILTSYFVAAMLGISSNIELWENNTDKLEEKLKSFQAKEEFKELTNTTKRVVDKIRYAKSESKYFSSL